MARTRQTARAGRPLGGREPPCFTNDEQQTELFCKLLRENCRVLQSSDDDKPSLQSKMAQYKNCTKLAKLWIAEDMVKNANVEVDEINEEYLQHLPNELKCEIISFIPTHSRLPSVYSIQEYYRVGGGELLGIQEVEYLDVWFISFMKYRVLSKSFKETMENLIFKTLSDKGLDLTGFILKCFTSIDRRTWFVYSLLEAHNRFIKGEWNGMFELTDYPLSQQEPQYFQDYANPFFPSGDNDETNTTNSTQIQNNLDVDSIDFGSIKAIEEELLEKGEYTTETPFNFMISKTKEDVHDLVDRQSIKILQLHNKFSHSEMLSRTDLLKSCTNRSITSLAISLSDNTLVHGILDQLPNIEHLTIILYHSFDTFYGFQSLNLRSRTNLKSVNIIAFDNPNWSDLAGYLPENITTIFVFLQDNPLINFTNVDTYLDGKLMEKDNNVTFGVGPPPFIQKVYLKSCDFKFFQELHHKYTLFPHLEMGFFFRVGSFTSLEDQKLFTDFIGKNYPLEDNFIQFTGMLRSRDLKELSQKQYLVYLSNTYHNGRVRTLPSDIPHSLFYGLDLTTNILKLYFPNINVTTLLLDHLKFLREKGLYKIDIFLLKKCFVQHLKTPVWKDQALKILFFACENLTEDERLLFFGDLVISQSLKFNILHVMMALHVEDYIFKSIIKYIPPQALLGKTSSIDTVIHTLHIAIDNPILSNDTILELIEKEPTIVHQVDSEKLTPLHYACKNSRRWDLIPHLVKITGPESWFAPDSNGKTPLYYAKLATNPVFHLFPYGPDK